MSRVIAVVEGQTEQDFVRRVLAPHLAAKGVFLDARVAGKPGHKGGESYARSRGDILILLKQDRQLTVTTMFDFYGMAHSWPGRARAATAAFAQKARLVEEAMAQDIRGRLGGSFDATRFVPYVQMHEFEALLFSHPEALCQVLRCPERAAEVQAVREAFSSPEEIDDRPTDAPSKRLVRLFAGYRKRLHGLIAAAKIGVEAMRAECPHFAEWLGKLESLRR